MYVLPSVFHWDTSDAEPLVTTVTELYLIHQTEVKPTKLVYDCSVIVSGLPHLKVSKLLTFTFFFFFQIVIRP